MRYIAIGFVVVSLGALAGWYLYLRKQGISITEVAVGRGFSDIIPSFNGLGGSTYQNIVAQAVDQVVGFVANRESPQPMNKLWHVDHTPVAGMGFVLGTTSSTTLSYAQQATGHIFTADPYSRIVERRTNILVPKTYRALFAYDGSFVLQAIGEDGVVRTIAGTPSASSTTDNASSTPKLGRDMPPNLRSIAFDPVSRTLFWITSDLKGGVVGASVPWGAATGTRLFSSSVGGWRLIVEKGRYMATIAPEDGIPGYAYEITKQGVWVPILRNIPGLSFLPSEDPSVYTYSVSDGASVSLYLTSSASSTPQKLPMGTVADKCAWTPGSSRMMYCAVPEKPPTGPFLGPWYRGTIHTEDAWWEVDAATGDAQEIYSMLDANDAAIDVVNPTVDPSGNFISFQDAKDSSLWVLRIH